MDFGQGIESEHLEPPSRPIPSFPWLLLLSELGTLSYLIDPIGPTSADGSHVPLYRATKHTTFTALREAGVSRDEVQALARHRDPRTTDIYDLDDDQRRQRALASLDRLEARGRQTGDRGKRVAKLRKSAKS